jgi:hypothetical protein
VLSAFLTVTPQTLGQQVSVTIDERNPESANKTEGVANKWALNNLTLGNCGTLNFPFGMAFYQGDYNANNLPTGAQLKFYPPGQSS